MYKRQVPALLGVGQHLGLCQRHLPGKDLDALNAHGAVAVSYTHLEYALDALQIFVSGFLLKPANEADVRNVLENLRYPPETAPVGIKIQCFGADPNAGIHGFILLRA